MNDQEFNVDEAQIGRILHFVIDKGYKLQCRPAQVVEDWPDQGKPGYVNLVVTLDGTNDGAYGTDQHQHDFQEKQPLDGQPSDRKHTGGANIPRLHAWETSVLPNHSVKAARTWHWPRECKNLHNPAPAFIDIDTKETVPHNHAEGVVDVNNCYGCRRAAQAATRPVK